MYTQAHQYASRNSHDLELEQRKSGKGTAPADSHPIAQLQRMIGNQAVAQLLSAGAPAQRREGSSGQRQGDQENRTGMPDHLKSGLENLSGLDLSDVKVHYNSDKPSQLNALAYAQGTDIHIGPGQEEHLPHEGWHVVQQKQGRVKPTISEGSVAINDDAALESEADKMGSQALQMKAGTGGAKTVQLKADASGAQALQMKVVQRQQTEIYVKNITGSYTDNTGSHDIDYPSDTYITKTNSHPRGRVSYDDQVKKMLKKNGVVPKSVPDDQITITYEQYGKKL